MTDERPEYLGEGDTGEDEETTDQSSFVLFFCCSTVFCNTVSSTPYTCVAIPSWRYWSQSSCCPKDYTEGTQLEPSWLRRNDECVDVCGEKLGQAEMDIWEQIWKTNCFNMFQQTSKLNIVVRSYVVYIFCMYTVRGLEKEYYHQSLKANSATETDRISLHFGFTNNQTCCAFFIVFQCVSQNLLDSRLVAKPRGRELGWRGRGPRWREHLWQNRCKPRWQRGP